MRRIMVLICLVAVLTAFPRVAEATCGEDCDMEYQSDVETCHVSYGDDPADAADLARCIDNARGDYRSCVEDCANEAD
jgi:hypothetical protein